jgi:hypothetical protein
LVFVAFGGVCLDTKNNGAFPLDLACFECLNVMVATQFATNEQLKNLTHTCSIFESHVTNYIKKAYLLCSQIKIHVPFWDELKKF